MELVCCKSKYLPSPSPTLPKANILYRYGGLNKDVECAGSVADCEDEQGRNMGERQNRQNEY